MAENYREIIKEYLKLRHEITTLDYRLDIDVLYSPEIGIIDVINVSAGGKFSVGILCKTVESNMHGVMQRVQDAEFQLLVQMYKYNKKKEIGEPL